MNVRKGAQRPDPHYPSQRQFAEYKRVLGVAAIGLGTMAGAARAADEPARLLGDVAIEPRQTVSACATTNATPKPSEPVRLPGEIKAMPPPLGGVPPMVPKQATTNAQARATPAATNAVPPERLRGEMPATNP